jgi:hypothetical protein
VHERANDGQRHADFSEVHAPLRRLRMTQSLEPEDEKNRGEQVAKFYEVGLPNHKNDLGALSFVLCCVAGKPFRLPAELWLDIKDQSSKYKEQLFISSA